MYVCMDMFCDIRVIILDNKTRPILTQFSNAVSITQPQLAVIPVLLKTQYRFSIPLQLFTLQLSLLTVFNRLYL